MAEVVGVGFRIQSKYIKELYKSISKGCDLPPPSGLTGPSGDMLIDQFDPRLYKTIKKLNKHRKRLLKENKLNVAFPARTSSTLPPISSRGDPKTVVPHLPIKRDRDPLIIQDFEEIDPTAEVKVKINHLDNNFHELDDPFDDFHDVHDQIIVKNNGRKRTRIKTRTRSISPTPVKRRAPTTPTRNLAKIVKRKTIDELHKEIEKEKRLIILLEPLSVYLPTKSPITDDEEIISNSNGPDFNEVIDSDSDNEYVILPKSKKKRTRKKCKKSVKQTTKVKIFKKIQCPRPNCKAMIAWNSMTTHLKAHTNHGNNIHIKPVREGRPIKKKYENDSKVCPICGEQNFKRLDLHIVGIHEGSKSTASKILQHKKPLKSVCCTICLENFEDEKSNEYFLHMKTHNLDWKISCTFCKDNFSNFNDYTGHINTIHQYQCPILECNEGFRNLSSIKEHMREKHLEKCKEFNIPEEGKIENFVCSYCPSTYSHKNGLDDHLIMHQDPAAVTCTLCPRTKIFKGKTFFDHHMINIHGEKTLPCTFEGCLKKFSSNLALRRHLTNHDPNSSISINSKLRKSNQSWWKDPTKIYKCTADGCEKEFTNNSNSRSRYRNHVSVFHTEIDPSSKQEIFTCPIEFCPAKSESRKVMNLHIKLEHAEHSNDFVKNAEKKFKCSYCERSYNYQHALKDHEISHTDPAQTTCEICNKFYNSKTMKNVHQKEAHGSKEFKCLFPNCTSIFSTEVYLKRHIKSVHYKK